MPSRRYLISLLVVLLMFGTVPAFCLASPLTGINAVNSGQIGIRVTSTAGVLKKGDYVDVAASFETVVPSNAIIVYVYYDEDKFTYVSNLGGNSEYEQYIEGISYLHTETSAGYVCFTVMIPSYEARDLIRLRF